MLFPVQFRVASKGSLFEFKKLIHFPLAPVWMFMHAKLLQWCSTLCDPIDCSPPDSSVHGILQARILEWVAMSSSRGSSWYRDWAHCLLCLLFWWVLYHSCHLKVKVAQLCPTLCDPMGLYSPWNSPGQNTRVGSLSLLQGISPTQGLNPGLPHCRQILYQLSHQGSPRILEWVAYPFSSRSSWPRNWTGVSCITGGFFTNWAIREAQNKQRLM